jgi:hypothetical protein
MAHVLSAIACEQFRLGSSLAFKSVPTEPLGAPYGVPRGHPCGPMISSSRVRNVPETEDLSLHARKILRTRELAWHRRFATMLRFDKCSGHTKGIFVTHCAKPQQKQQL